MACNIYIYCLHRCVPFFCFINMSYRWDPLLQPCRLGKHRWNPRISTSPGRSTWISGYKYRCIKVYTYTILYAYHIVYIYINIVMRIIVWSSQLIYDYHSLRFWSLLYIVASSHWDNATPWVNFGYENSPLLMKNIAMEVMTVSRYVNHWIKWAITAKAHCNEILYGYPDSQLVDISVHSSHHNSVLTKDLKFQTLPKSPPFYSVWKWSVGSKWMFILQNTVCVFIYIYIYVYICIYICIYKLCLIPISPSYGCFMLCILQ